MPKGIEFCHVRAGAFNIHTKTQQLSEVLCLYKHLSRLKTARSSLKEELNRRCAELMSTGQQNSVMVNDSTFLIGQIWTNIRPGLTTFSYNRHVKKITFAWLGRTIDLQCVVQTLWTEEVSML